MTKDTMKDAAIAADSLLFDDWFDAIEDWVRARVRGFIETMLEEELYGALCRPRYVRGKPNADGEPPAVVGVRHGHRKRGLTGTFGRMEISVPRARLVGADGRTSERRSASLHAYQRRTKAADALIAGAYLSGRLCQSNCSSSAYGVARPDSSSHQAARARHSANAAERLCL